MKYKDAISQYLLDSYRIDGNKDIVVKNIDAKELILSDRIDLIAKMQYLDSLEKHMDTKFFVNQYKSTIEAFTDGSYTEQGAPEKNNFEKYRKAFHNIYNSTKKEGFKQGVSVIPTTTQNVILDGAHRTAAAAYLNKKVAISEITGASCSYNYKFFRKKALDERYLDNMVFEYAKMKDNIYVICLWPTCSQQQQKEISEYISNQFKVVYEKDVDFSYNGLKNFMSQIYYEQDWIGTLENGYKGAAKKVDLCYKSGRPTHILVVEEKDVNKIVQEKANIRKKIGIGNHSIHSTDDHIETMKMLTLVLNDNSIFFLNNASPYKYKEHTAKLRKMRKELTGKNIPLESIIVDSGTVLALFGLRNSDDLDILVDERYSNQVDGIFDKHNDAVALYETTLDDIIYNPDNYFYYENIKIISPTRLLVMKKNRAEKKDYDDLKILSTLLKGKKQGKILKAKTIMRRKTNHIKNRLISTLIPILQKIGIYEHLKKIFYEARNE